MNRKELAIALSKLKTFESVNANLEQYPTNSEIASDFLWNIHMSEGFDGKIVADFGCGTGIIGIGALMLGAKKVIFIDIDEHALHIAQKNLKSIEDKLGKEFGTEFLIMPVNKFHGAADMVLQNPPFGVQTEHADKAFLLKAMETAPLIYSLHKTESKDFVRAIAEENGFSSKLYLRYKFPLKQSMRFHTKTVHYVDVGCFRIEKIKH